MLTTLHWFPVVHSIGFELYSARDLVHKCARTFFGSPDVLQRCRRGGRANQSVAPHRPLHCARLCILALQVPEQAHREAAHLRGSGLEAVWALDQVRQPVCSSCALLASVHQLDVSIPLSRTPLDIWPVLTGVVYKQAGMRSHTERRERRHFPASVMC